MLFPCYFDNVKLNGIYRLCNWDTVMFTFPFTQNEKLEKALIYWKLNRRLRYGWPVNYPKKSLYRHIRSIENEELRRGIATNDNFLQSQSKYRNNFFFNVQIIIKKFQSLKNHNFTIYIIEIIISIIYPWLSTKLKSNLNLKSYNFNHNKVIYI